MNSNQLFYQKYLKYKNKYLELKELLGGRDPAYYNRLQIRIDFKESPFYKEIRNIISKFIEDLIVKYALEKMNMTARDDQAQGLQFLEIIFKNSSTFTQGSAILKHVKTIVDSMIWDETSFKRDSDYTTTMNLIKVNKDSTPFGDNIHISLSPTGGVNKPDIDFHLTEYFKVSGTSTHYNTEAGVYNFFRSTNTTDLRDDLVEKYLVLAVYAFNFFVSDESHDLLETVLLSTSPEVNAYITMLSTKYIPRFFNLMLENNLNPIYNYSDIYEDIKEVFEQDTKEEANCCIKKVYFNASIRQKEIEDEARRIRTEAKAKADEDARVAAEAKSEKEKVAAIEAAKAKAKEDAENAAALLRANNIDAIRETIISTYGDYINPEKLKQVKETEQIVMIHKWLESFETILSKGLKDIRDMKKLKEYPTSQIKSVNVNRFKLVLNTTGMKRYEKLLN